MSKKNVLVKGSEAVIFLFTAFGGYLTRYAPPNGTDAVFFIGLSQFIALFVLFFISALSNQILKNRFKIIWIILALISLIIFVTSSLFYIDNYRNLSIDFPPTDNSERVLIGTEYTDSAQSLLDENNDWKAQDVLSYLGILKKETVWTKESIDEARDKLNFSYVLMIVSLSIALFSLIEGVILSKEDT